MFRSEFEHEKINNDTDTGAGDTMYADPTFVNNFWSQVGGSRNSTGTWTFPCNSTIPSMKISAGRTGSYFILGTTFNAGVVEGMTGESSRNLSCEILAN